MTVISFTLVLAGVLLNAAAQLLLKAGTNRIGTFSFSTENILPISAAVATQPHILLGLACYGISVVVWIMALSRTPVSVAYPMLSIGYVVNAFGAWYLFGEAVTPMRLVGTGIIILGVFIVARS
ncbi:MAG: SMR family transporter [Burkholderiales bacterium]